jgi:hypothetical protein
MQKGGVNNVIADICTFLRHEVFHVDGTFLDLIGTLVEFPQHVIMIDFLCKQLMHYRVFDYIKVCTYNKFEYCNVFGYYLNVYM